MSGEPRIAVLEDADAVSQAAAVAIAGALARAVDEHGRADWATTGGSTPVGIYRVLAAPPLREAVPWHAVHVWWGDDRFVPRDHPLSNVMPLDQVLLAAAGLSGQSGTGEDGARPDGGAQPGVPLLVEHVHAPNMGRAIRLGAGPELVASEYDAELRAAGLDLDPAGFGVFDVILIGIGPDGHLFSVFPSSPLFESDAWVSAVPAPTHVEPHVARVSLNPGFVAAAREPIVVVHGTAKSAIGASVFGPERDVRRWPAQLARREGASWFLDKAAAGQLPASVTTRTTATPGLA